ncbi:tetratricopeptide repeat-containing sensor histidine kinase [Cryomorpha ignava]|nr:histidine kinase dimerization/phosphoacceptor domain -containing protein [Cryomorpha ignava]
MLIKKTLKRGSSHFYKNILFLAPLFVLCFFFSPKVHAQTDALDSLENIYSTAPATSPKLDILEQMAGIAFRSDLNKALIYTGRGVALADKSEDKIRQPVFYEMHGRMYANLLKLDSATHYFNKAMAGYKAIDNKRGQATTAFKLSWVSKRKGDIEAAMTSDLFALKIMEELGDKPGIASAYGRVAENLMGQRQASEALKYALKGMEVCEANNLDEELFYANRTLGDAYMFKSDYEESLTYYKKAFEIGKRLNLGEMNLADISNCLGNAYKRLGRYEEALVEYDSCLQFAQRANYPGAMAAANANLGETNLLIGNFAEALPYQLATIKMQEEDGDISNLVENYNHTATIYGKLGNYELAWDYEKRARALHDSLLSEKSDVALSELRTRYETEKNEGIIESQMLQLNQRNKVQWLTAGVAFLLAGFLFFLYRLYRIRTKNNILLKVKNAENELLLKEIHHRVKNNLEVVSSLLELQSAQIDDKGIKDAMQEGQNRVQSIGIVHQKLYMGKNLGAIEMKDYFLNLSESILDSFGADDRVTVECVMEQLDVDIDTAVPLGLIVNELLTNTLKYGFPDGRKGHVRIHLEKDMEGSLYMEVADNGIGKSEITKGTGFGSQLISLLTRQLSGSMREEIVNGTKVFFQFNLKKQYGG